MTGVTTIMIAEDQGMMRSALSALLELEAGMTVVAEVARGEDVVAEAARSVPDVILLDIELPGRSGLDLIAELIETVPDCAVIIVTTFGRPGYLKRALEAGARGFLVKDDPVEELADSIRAAVSGRIVVNPLLATQALSASVNPLTDREHDVLAASVDGATIADIAASLHLSQSTVRNYLSSAIGKTGARNRIEASRLARERGWL